MKIMRKPMTWSVGLHLCVILALLMDFGWHARSFTVAKSGNLEPKIVKAVAIDGKAVKEEIEKIKIRERRQAQQEKSRRMALAKMRAQERQAKLRREKEEKRLALLKKNAKALLAKQKEAAAAQARQLAALQAKQRLEQEKLEKQQREQAKVQKALLQKQAEMAKAKEAARQNELAREKAKAQAEAKKREQAEQAQKALQEQQRAAEFSRRYQGVINHYSALIKQSVERRWIIPQHVKKDLTCQLLIRLAPSGNVLTVKLVSSSGNTALDRSAIAAVYKASPLPVPSQPEVFDKFKELRLTVRPEGLLGA